MVEEKLSASSDRLASVGHSSMTDPLWERLLTLLIGRGK